MLYWSCSSCCYCCCCFLCVFSVRALFPFIFEARNFRLRFWLRKETEKPDFVLLCAYSRKHTLGSVTIMIDTQPISSLILSIQEYFIIAYQSFLYNKKEKNYVTCWRCLDAITFWSVEDYLLHRHTHIRYVETYQYNNQMNSVHNFVHNHYHHRRRS